MKNHIITFSAGALVTVAAYLSWQFYQLQKTVTADHAWIVQTIQLINNSQKAATPTK